MRFFPPRSGLDFGIGALRRFSPVPSSLLTHRAPSLSNDASSIRLNSDTQRYPWKLKMLPYLGSLVDVIKLRMRRLSWIVWVGSKCNLKCLSKREGEDMTQREESGVKWNTEI